jgi:hypothetical protein
LSRICIGLHHGGRFEERGALFQPTALAVLVSATSNVIDHRAQGLPGRVGLRGELRVQAGLSLDALAVKPGMLSRLVFRRFGLALGGGTITGSSAFPAATSGLSEPTSTVAAP